MSVIRTVLGDIGPETTGVTAMHEHVLLFPEEEWIAAELSAFREAGGQTLVEVTTLGLVDIADRKTHAERLKRLSQTSQVKIVAGTGLYKEPRLPALVLEWSVDRLADYMVVEIQEGISGTPIRAGIIGEVGSSNYQVYPTEEKVLHAAGQAQATTGVSITTHTGRGTMAHNQLDIFASEGVDLGRVVIGHQDVQPRLTPLLGYYCELLDRGANIQFDTIGKEGFFELHLDPAYGQKFPYNQERAEIVAELISRGYQDQILLSCDIDTFELTGRGGGKGYAGLLSFQEDLKKAGVAPQIIRRILVENPRRMLSF